MIRLNVDYGAAMQQAQVQALQAQQNAAAQEDLYTWLQKRAQLQVSPAPVRLPRNTGLPEPFAAEMQKSLYNQLDRLMFGCGGALENDPAAVELLQQMVTQYLDSLLHAAMNEAAAAVSRPSQHEQVQRALTRNAAEGFGVHSVLAVLRQHNLSHAAHVEHVMSARARLSSILHAPLTAGTRGAGSGGAEEGGEQQGGREGAAAGSASDALYTLSAEEQCYTSSRVYVPRPSVRNVLEAQQAEAAWGAMEAFHSRASAGLFRQLQGQELEQAQQAVANQVQAAVRGPGAVGNVAMTAGALVAQQRAALQARAAATAVAASRMPVVNQAIIALQQAIPEADALRAIERSPEHKLLFTGHELYLKVAEELIVIDKLKVAAQLCSTSSNPQHQALAQNLVARIAFSQTQLANVTQQRRIALGLAPAPTPAPTPAPQQAQLVAQLQAYVQAQQAAARAAAAGGMPSAPLSAAALAGTADGGTGHGAAEVQAAAAAVAALAASGTLPLGH